LGLLNLTQAYLADYVKNGQLIALPLDKPLAPLSLYLYHTKKQPSANTRMATAFILQYFKLKPV
jgi:hypothetical protein